VLDDYERCLRALADWSDIDRLADARVYHEPLRGDVLHAALAEAEVVVLMRDRTPFRAELIERLPKLRYVVLTGTRNTALDTAALAARGIPVSHTEWGPSKDSTAELTWALILARQAARSPVQDDALRRRRDGSLVRCACGRASWPDRARRDRWPRRSHRQGLRHGCRRLEPAHDRGARGGEGRARGVARRAARDVEGRQPAPRADRSHAEFDEFGTPRPDAHGRFAGQYVTLGAGRHGGAG
jgi:hypothetical protein